MTKLVRTTMMLGAAIAFLGPVLEADAATARVRCRVREARTQISVDGNRLEAGSYLATVDSGTDAAGTVAAKPRWSWPDESARRNSTSTATRRTSRAVRRRCRADSSRCPDRSAGNC